MSDGVINLSEKKILFMFGPSGSGKGYFVTLLASAGLDFEYLSTGEVLRDLVKTESAEARYVKELMRRGDHVPTEIITKTAFSNLRHTKKKLIVVDGFPRNCQQVDYLINTGELDIDFNKVCGINIRRSLKRCLKQVGGSKDRAGREDDHDQCIIDKYKLYESATIPAIRRMHSAGMGSYETGDVSDLESVVPYAIRTLGLEVFITENSQESKIPDMPLVMAGQCANFML